MKVLNLHFQEVLYMEEDISTFLRDDSIGRNSFLNILMNLLSNMPSPSTVALNGKWGSGKPL